MSLDLEKQLTFYGAYHRNPVNVGIHITCVPMILAASIVLVSKTPTLIPLPELISIPYLQLNLGTITALIYSGYYILLEPVAGSMLFPPIMCWAAYSNYLISIDPSTALKGAALVEVVSWLAQFAGHAFFEHRAPALLDNLVGALVLAPFFVFMEVLFKFGYRPELHKRMQISVNKEISRFEAEKAQKAE